MMAPVHPDRHAALMARAEERLHRSHQLAQQIGESLLLVRNATCVIEAQFERHGPDEPITRLSLTDDVFLHSYKWARPELDIPLPSIQR